MLIEKAIKNDSKCIGELFVMQGSIRAQHLK